MKIKVEILLEQPLLVNSNLFKMQQILFAIISLFFACNNLSLKERSEKYERTKCTTVTSMISVQYDDKTGDAIKFDTSYGKIYYKGNIVLYETAWDFYEAVNGEIVKNEKRKTFFVFERDSSYGIRLNKWNSKENIRLRIDSFLTSDTYNVLNVSDNLKKAEFKLISSNRDYRLNQLIEKYIWTGKSDSTSGDAVFYYSDKTYNKEYSFSKELDSAKGMKLYKIKLFPHINTLPEGMKVLPKFSFITEIKEGYADNETEISDCIKNYKQSFK